ncbi:MAG: hypothetical protein ACRDR6_14135 [Pseudonocardiaceae bacterium]
MQVEPGDVEALVGVTEGPGSGMVVSGKGAIHAIEYACGRGYRQPFLADRQLYKGKARCAATRPFDPDWISRQRRLGLPVILPDAGYVAETDIVGLRHVLIESAKIDGAVALLAIANWWLHGPGLRLLLSEVTDNPTPLALVIEHDKDPFSARRILAGVLDLLATGVPVIPLRCDISALGLMAHGAVAAAFGSQTSLRHLYPVRNGGGGGGGKRSESAVWPTGFALHYSDLLHDVVSASPSDPRWRCDCSVCDGDRLDRLSTALLGEVRAHNTASVLQLRTALTAQAPDSRRRLWRRWAQVSQLEHESVSTEAVALDTPKAMINWTRTAI